MMRNVFIGLYLLSFGIAAVVLHKYLGESTARMWERFVDFQAHKRNAQFGFLLGGALFVVVGLLIMFGLLRVK